MHLLLLLSFFPQHPILPPFFNSVVTNNQTPPEARRGMCWVLHATWCMYVRTCIPYSTYGILCRVCWQAHHSTTPVHTYLTCLVLVQLPYGVFHSVHTSSPILSSLSPIPLVENRG